MGSFYLFSAKHEDCGKTFVRVGETVVVIACVVLQLINYVITV